MACTCLTCAIMGAIEGHAETVHSLDPRLGGPTIDGQAVITAVANVVGSLIAEHPDTAFGDALLKMAHEALDASVVAHRTGEVQVVTMDAAGSQAVN